MIYAPSTTSHTNEQYGLIGYPLGHSFSAQYFNDFFAREGLDAHYAAYPIQRIEELTELINYIPSLRGVNVTSPYKERVLPLLDRLTPTAQRVGAVNAIAIRTSPLGQLELVGHNTDVAGFIYSLKPLLSDKQPRHSLILGTGGASKAVAIGLEELGLSYDFASRHQGRHNTICYDALTPNLIRERYGLIINATPLGMGEFIGQIPPIPLEGIGEQHLCYDLIYNPSPTRFLEECSKRGARIMDGLTMLHAQADAAWHFWQSL